MENRIFNFFLVVGCKINGRYTDHRLPKTFFTKRIVSISNLSYLERLQILGLVPLELRRLHFDLIQYYKIFNNMTSLNQSDYFTHHHPSSFSRKQESFLIKPFNKPNYLLTSFFYRSVDCWNSLPLSVKNSTSLHTFKTKLLTVDLSLYLIGSAFV